MRRTYDESVRKFGLNLKALRAKKGMTQEQLAEITGFSPIYIGFIENSKRSATIKTIVRLYKGLNCKPGDLFKGI